MTATWNYASCDLCKGKGKIRTKEECPICKGFGIWEFVAEDNEAAVRFLNDPEADVSEAAKELCGRRIAAFSPDTVDQTLLALELGSPQVGSPEFNAEWDSIHQEGAAKWGWAWVHTNRFAIALCKLNGADHLQHPYALSQLVWNWLEEEQQEKIDAPC